MADVINYHIHMTTSFSRDGYMTITKNNVQTGHSTTEKFRKMTKKEIIRHVKYRKAFKMPVWLNKNIYEGLI